METTKLNLARKWRSQSFESVIGQELTVKILKNSLYVGHFFPVYLFSGQRGCGKTTTARLFASALNCDALDAFQKKPKEIIIPCGLCISCNAMREGRHQDFIEIDAASHTGVDMIRQLIEDATFLPVMGRKKIYLIDEAHMLSKAAFNALLKILEEPPLSAIFILATTDADKIIDTVRSRCFALNFRPIKQEALAAHLISICNAEKIQYREEGLSYIAAHADGSARDALNILEQVRFASGGVTKQTVLSVLGHVDDVHLLELCILVATGSLKDVLSFWQTHDFASVSADYIWQGLLSLARMLIWLHHGVLQEVEAHILYPKLQQALPLLSLDFLQQLMEALYKAEPLFIRTTAQQGLLELVLLQLCQKRGRNSGGSGGAASPMPALVEHGSADVDTETDQINDDEEDESDDEEGLWQAVCTSIAALEDHLLTSLFSQSVFRTYNRKEAKIHIAFPARLGFFKDQLWDSQAKWEKVLRAVFGNQAVLEASFDIADDSAHVSIKPASKVSAPPVRDDQERKPATHVQARSGGYNRQMTEIREKKIDVSDTQKWRKTNLVLTYFPGVVTEVQEAKQL